MKEHLPACAMGYAKPCPAGKTLHGEGPSVHCWLMVMVVVSTNHRVRLLTGLRKK